MRCRRRYALAPVLALVLDVVLALVGPLPATAGDAPAEVRVVLSLPGRTSEEVERLAAVPVELALAGAPGVASVRSVSAGGLAVVTAVLGPGADVHAVRRAVLDRLGAARDALPEDMETPVLGPLAAPLRHAVRYTLRGGEGTDAAELRALHDFEVRPRLLAVPGVADVLVCGGAVRELRVDVDLDRLGTTGLSLDDVLDALESANAEAPTGRLVRGASSGAGAPADDVGDVVVGVREGVPVRLRDVARIEVAAVARDGFAARRGDAVVEGIVLGRDGPPPAEAVARVLAEARARLPAGVALEAFGLAGPSAPLALRVVLPPGTSPDAAREAAGRAAALVRAVKGVSDVLVEVDGPGDDLPGGFGALGSRIDVLALVAADAGAPPEALARELATVLGRVPGASSARPPEGAVAEVRLVLLGADLEALDGAARRLLDAVRSVAGVEAAFALDEDEGGEPRRVSGLAVVPDRQALAKHGIAPATVGRAAEAALDGIVVTSVLEGTGGERRMGVRVRAFPEATAGPDTLGRVPLRAADGAIVALSSVASIERRPARATIRRVDGERALHLFVRPAAGQDVAPLRQSLKRLVEEDFEAPPGIRVVVLAEES